MTRTQPRRGLALALLAAVAVPLGACGSGRSGLTAVEQNQLVGMISQARAAAVAGNPAGAQTALTELRNTVSQLRTAGVLDPARAARMQSVAAQAQAAVRAQAASSSRVARAPAPTPRAPAPAAPAPTAPGPSAIIDQGAGALKQRVEHALGQGVGKLKHRITQLQQQIAGQGGGGSGPGGGGGD